MAPSQKNPEAWVECAVSELREAGSWTGRIHIHKLLAILELAGAANPPFEFELYHYGPYSRELDTTIAEMEFFGQLSHEFPRPGYGPRYEVVDPASRDLDLPDATAIRKAARALGDRPSSDLELIATCLWLIKRERVSDKTQVVDRVAKLKPKYKNDRDRIQQSFDEACKLEAALRSE